MTICRFFMCNFCQLRPKVQHKQYFLSVNQATKLFYLIKDQNQLIS